VRPELLSTIADLRRRLAGVRRAGKTIGFVPTMGALHEGHGALIDHAREGSDYVVVSIFVNPTQFNQRSDYDAYTRDLDDDIAFCTARGAQAVFAPSVEEMYPREAATFVEVTRLEDHLCGQFRPGHFRGVATVVTKLLNIIVPDRACFGEKDAQQLAIIQRMVADLNIPVEIVPVPTVRESDGLALSSRNLRLTPEERRIAPAIYHALQRGLELIESGALTTGEVISEIALDLQKFPPIRVEYIEIVDSITMTPVEQIAAPVVIAVAAWLGPTRLIDNVRWAPHQSTRRTAGSL
jgi:pantoate--beta-alanine ligase